MKKELHFQIKLTARELWQFSMYHAYISLTGIFCVIFTLVSLFLILTRWGTLEGYQRVLLVICTLIFTVWQPALLYHKACRQAKRTAVSKPMHLFFKEDGLMVRQGGETANFAWDQIGRIDRMKTMAIVYMDRIHAYLIPKSAMGRDEEVFYEMAKKYLPQGRTRRF